MTGLGSYPEPLLGRTSACAGCRHWSATAFRGSSCAILLSPPTRPHGRSSRSHRAPPPSRCRCGRPPGPMRRANAAPWTWLCVSMMIGPTWSLQTSPSGNSRSRTSAASRGKARPAGPASLVRLPVGGLRYCRAVRSRYAAPTHSCWRRRRSPPSGPRRPARTVSSTPPHHVIDAALNRPPVADARPSQIAGASSPAAMRLEMSGTGMRTR